MSYRKQIGNFKRRRVRSSSPIEELYYELKPYLYLGVVFLAMNSEMTLSKLVKIATFGVIVYSGLVIYNRLEHRGYINKPY